MRDGPTLWRVIVAVQRRRADTGENAADHVEQFALDALGRAWFFGLALDQPEEDADARYLRFVAAHPRCSGAEVQRGLGSATSPRSAPSCGAWKVEVSCAKKAGPGACRPDGRPAHA